MSKNDPIPPNNYPPVRQEETNLFDYVAVIMRRGKIFIAVLCTIFLIVALYTFLMKPVYEASSLLHVKEDKGKGQLLGELMLNTPNPTNAEIEIVKSRTNAEQVVHRLHLDAIVSKKSDGLTFKIIDFKSSSKNPVYRIKLTGKDTFEVKDDDGKIVDQGKSGALVQKNGFSLLLGDIKGEKGDSFQLELASFEETVERLRKNIKALEQGRQTGVIRVSYTNTDPVLASEIVNTLVQAYLEQTVSFKSEEASHTVAFIDEQLQGLRGELDSSEKSLKDYKSATGIVELDSEAKALIDKISEMEKNRASVTLQRQQVEFARDALKKAIKKGSIYSPGIMGNDSVIAGLAAKLSELELQKKALLTDYTEAHQSVKNVQNQIEEVQNKLLGIYETSRANLAKEEEAIGHELTAYDKQMRKLPDVERDLARLTRVSKVNSDIYTFLLQKHEEARIAKASTISNIDIVDPAVAPEKPIKPKKGLYLLVGLLFGLAAGTGFALFQEYLDDTIKNADEAKRIFRIPLLGVIPHIPSHQAKSNGVSTDAEPLTTQREPKSVIAEAFRSLRTNLHFTAINKEKKIMLITSTFPREGKSIICANLANIISQTGARVLLIDCDLRRPFMHTKFGHSKTPGLSEILTGDISFDKAKHNTGISGLDMISAGTTPPNPSELLGSEAMRQFLLTKRENYDYILIDAPPVLAVTDAPVLTMVSDLVILVVEAGRVPVKVAEHMREILATLQATVAGLILNDKTGKGESYEYYGRRYYRYGQSYGNGYGYGYGYGYYSDEEHKNHRKVQWWEKCLETIKKKIKKPF